MRVAFLREKEVTLGPVPNDGPLPTQLALSPPEHAGQGAIELAAWRKTAPVESIFELGPIDWLRRTAGLGVRGAPSADALSMVVRYAFHELNLERLETDPVQPESIEALRAAGFVPTGDRWSAFRS